VIPVLTFTSLNDYRVCPKRFYHKYVAKDCPQEVKSSQQKGGSNLHDSLRKRIKLREPLPEEHAHLESVVSQVEMFDTDSIKYIETEMAIDFEGKKIGYNDHRALLRSKPDLAICNAPVAVLVDWKSGNVWEDPLELCIQALLLRAHRPELTMISGLYVWLKLPKIGALHVDVVNDTGRTLRNLLAMRKMMDTRLANNDWPPDEGPLCGWCPVGHNQCSFKREGKSK
jgi:PD-(D/E)XK nuclease superfamily